MSRTSALVFRIILALAIAGSGAALAALISAETPVGGIKGVVVARESGIPLSAQISLTAKSSTSGNQRSYIHSVSRKDGTFSISGIAVGQYELDIASDAHRMKPVKISIEESKTLDISVELTPNDPSMSMYVHQRVFTPDETAQVAVSGFIASEAISVSLYRVDMSDFLRRHECSLQKLIGFRSYELGSSQAGTAAKALQSNKSLSLAVQFKSPVKGRDLEGVFTYRIDLPKVKPGLYVVMAQADGIESVDWLAFTSLGIVTKTDGAKLLAYTVDLQSGVPKPNCEVAVYSNNTRLAAGITGSGGTLMLTLPRERGGDQERTVLATAGSSFAFAASWFPSSRETPLIDYTYTDRSVYRPGQKVFFKGIVRGRSGSDYKTPMHKAVVVEVRDREDTLIYRGIKRTNAFGSYNGSFLLNDEAATGYYSVVSSVDGVQMADSGNFKVAAYKKPEFKAKIDFGRKRYVRGDTVTANVSTEYYFGAPVVDADVRYFIYRSTYWQFDEDATDGEDRNTGDDRGNFESYGEFVSEGTVRTDSSGKAKIEFPANWDQPKEPYAWDEDQQFRVEATVTDRSGQSAEAKGSVPAVRGDFALRVTPNRYIVSPGSTTSFAVTAIDYDKKPIANQRVSFIVGEEKWGSNGSDAVGSDYTFTRLSEETVTTDSAGKATVQFTARKNGSLTAVAVARDGRGNRVTGRADLWVYSGGLEESSQLAIETVEIVTDKKTYYPGETARVLINAPKPNSCALVTVEGRNLYSYSTQRMKSRTFEMSVPIKAGRGPNFYIGVCIVRNKTLEQTTKRVKVSVASRKLTIGVKPDKPVYKPGDTAVYTVTASDSEGRPERAEVSIGVVDEAIYAIAPDKVTPIAEFFYARTPNLVQTAFSFPEIYLSDPDKAGVEMASIVRKRFVDTAFWKADIVTDSNGKATVSFLVPDNLTTWRATARAITSDTVCGEARSTAVTTKDLLVRLGMPSFLIQGDESLIMATVHNYTVTDADVRVTLQPSIQVSDPKGLRVDGALIQTIQVPSKGFREIRWKVSADGFGNYPVTVSVSSTAGSDAMRLVLPVVPRGEEREQSTSGSTVAGSIAMQKITIRSDAIADQSKVTVSLAPSLASTMFASLDYLAQYPYGCTEQTTSSFLPDVALYKSLKSLGVRNASLEADLPDMVSKGLARLYRFQLPDGGWSWCEYGKADTWMTSYVCYALVRAREAGLSVNTDRVRRGMETLGRMAGNKNIGLSARVYAYYVLSLYGKDVYAEMNAALRQHAPDARTLALATLAYAQMNHKEEAASALDRLLAEATVSATRVYWGDRAWYGAIETTALSLQAMLAVRPNDPMVLQIMRGLVTQKQGDRWYSTRDTAHSIYAFCEFLELTRELIPRFDATVIVNGVSVGSVRFDKESVFDPEQRIDIPAKLLKTGGNMVQIATHGVGNLYYGIKVRQFIARKHMSASISGEGVSISRVYYKPSPSYFAERSERELGSPVYSCRRGDIVMARVKVNTTRRLERLLMEDFFPAGFEVLDRGHVDYWEWDNWYAARDVRDRKVSFYVDQLSGTRVVEYQMRAAIPGRYSAMPARIYGMYDPDVAAATATEEFIIR